ISVLQELSNTSARFFDASLVLYQCHAHEAFAFFPETGAGEEAHASSLRQLRAKLERSAGTEPFWHGLPRKHGGPVFHSAPPAVDFKPGEQRIAAILVRDCLP